MRLGVAWVSSVALSVLDLDAAWRRLGVVCHWIQMRLCFAWALSVNGCRCGSASLGRRLPLNLDAARCRLGIVCHWIQMRILMDSGGF